MPKPKRKDDERSEREADDEIAEGEQTPGYRRRKAELDEIEDAGGSMNAATSGTVKRARGALARQAQIIRLRRRQK